MRHPVTYMRQGGLIDLTFCRSAGVPFTYNFKKFQESVSETCTIRTHITPTRKNFLTIFDNCCIIAALELKRSMKKIWYPHRRSSPLFYNSAHVLNPQNRRRALRRTYGFPNALQGKLFDVRV